MTASSTRCSGRLIVAVLVAALALIAAGCSDTAVVEAGPEQPPATGADATPSADGDAEAEEGSEAPQPGGPFVDDPDTEVDEAVAYDTLVGLIDSLAVGDYVSAADLVIEDGVSEPLTEQLAISEDEAFQPGAMEEALARYCQATDCTADAVVNRIVDAEFLTVTFEVEVQGVGSSGEPLVTAVPVGAFEGQYHVNLLPFGSPALPGGDGSEGAGPVIGDDGVPFYFGADSPEGWRLAPVTDIPNGWLVTAWNRDGFRVPGHGGFAELGPLEPLGVGPITNVVNGYGFIYLQLEGDEQTIWRHDGGAQLTPAVTVPEPQRIVLEGAHVRDLEDVDLFYQIRSTGSPENAVDKLFRHHVPGGGVTEIMETGGWESGTAFHGIEGNYPMALALRHSEAATWMEIVNLETGEIVYDSDEAGLTCFDGEPGCPYYEVATLVDGVVYGLRGDDSGDSPVLAATGLFRFDPEAGTEEVVSRFEWDNGLWYPHSIAAGPFGLMISVGDFEGDVTYPAVAVDPTTGLAETMAFAGFVGPSYLS